MSDSLQSFIQCLRDADSVLSAGVGLGPGAEEIADMLWLAEHLPKTAYDESATLDEDSETEPRSDETSEGVAPSVDLDTAVRKISNKLLTQKGKAAQSTAKPLRIPAAAALRQPLKLARSLRALARKTESRTQEVIDEEATAIAIAENNPAGVVRKPAQERWLDLELIVEHSRVASLWQQTSKEFVDLLERLGAFRTVRVWTLHASEEGGLYEPHLTSGLRSSKNTVSRTGKPKELTDASGRRLVMMLSDCISPLWRQGIIHDWLCEWSNNVPTVIVQWFPAAYWARTGLRAGDEVWLSALTPGIVNNRLNRQYVGLDPESWVEVEENVSKTQAFVIPVVSLESESLRNWSRVVSGFGGTHIVGRRFELTFDGQHWRGPVKNPRQLPVSSSERFRLFMGTASELAKDLARLISLGPVSPEITHLIQETLLPHSGAVHVAEVFLSGLLEETELGNYQFTSEVKNLLQESTMKADERSVFLLLSRYISEHYKKSPREFRAFLQKHDDWDEEDWSKIEGFAELQQQVELIEEVLGNNKEKLDEEIEDREKLANYIREPRMSGATAEETDAYVQTSSVVQDIPASEVETSSQLSTPSQLDSELTTEISIRRILVLAANPRDIDPLAFNREFREIGDVLQSTHQQKQFELSQRWAARLRDMQRAVLETDPQVIHFLGCDSKDSCLVFENARGEAWAATAVDLNMLLSASNDQLQCILLNGCYSDIQARAIIKNVPYVIGIPKAISERAKLAFTTGFYDAIGAGHDIKFAFDMGCTSIALDTDSRVNRKIDAVDIAPAMEEHHAPILLKQSSKTSEFAVSEKASARSSISQRQPYSESVGEQPVEVFISYAHEDEPLKVEFYDYLSNLIHQGKIKPWSDRATEAGSEWSGELKVRLASAEVILLLVTPRFIASDYCSGREMQQAMELHHEGRALVIPILIQPCNWQGSPFGKLQALPRNGKPVSAWISREEAWQYIVFEIRKLIDLHFLEAANADSDSFEETSSELERTQISEDQGHLSLSEVVNSGQEIKIVYSKKLKKKISKLSKSNKKLTKLRNMVFSESKEIWNIQFHKLRNTRSNSIYAYRVDRRLRGICELRLSKTSNSYIFEFLDIVDHDEYSKLQYIDRKPLEKAEIVSTRIRDIRSQLGMTQAQLAGELGISQFTLHNWENEESRTQQRIKQWMLLANLLQCSIEDLVVRNDTSRGENDTPGDESDLSLIRYSDTALRYNISDLRKAAGLTQEYVAEKIDVSVSTIQNWERGRSSPSHLVLIINLCKVLRCEVEDLLSQSDATKTASFE